MVVTVSGDMGIRDFRRYCQAAPDIAATSARIALNTVATRALKKDFPKAMRAQVAFPTGYLEDPTRLDIDRPATNDELITSIFGRVRPTSLARFAGDGLAQFQARGKTNDVLVTVKPGHAIKLKRVFPMKLRVGDGENDSFNLGLAIRLAPNEVLAHRTQGNTGIEIPGIPNVYLLYGPSVGQIFDDVAEDIVDGLGDDVSDEFVRQFQFRSEEYLK